MIYESVNSFILPYIPKSAESTLDIGCGSGALGKQIKQNISCKVVGVTYSESEAALASKSIDRVVVRDLNSFDTSELGKFDCVICSHILEHLYQPEKLLGRLHSNLTAKAVLIVALPNVLHWRQRLEFLKGRFKYTDGGLMDKTHFRFFDIETGRQLIEKSGYEVIKTEAYGCCPLPLIRRFLPSGLSFWLDSVAVNQLPGLLGFQFVFICRSNLA